MSTRTLHVNTTHPVARRALAVGSTAAGGSVIGALRDYLRCPRGGWPQTKQARQRLYEAVDCAARAEHDETEAAVDAMIEGAVWR